MAFTYHDHATGKSVFDIACSEMVGRGDDGAIYPLIKGGAVQVPDWVIQGSMKEKPQIKSLTNITTAAPTDLPEVITDIAAIKAKVNLIIAALKA